MRERETPGPKVWQPWYLDAEGGGGKELPSRSQREQRTRDRLTIQRPTLPNASPISPGCSSSEEDEINVVDSPPPPTRAAITTHYAYDYEDGPLDMSIKRRSASPPSPRPPHHFHHHHATPNTPSPPPYHPRPHYLPRPSVITCATLNTAPSNSSVLSSSPPHAHRERPLPPPYHHHHHRFITTVTTTNTTPTPSRRQVLQACPVDPEIDEHFRRSLGRDYHHLFSPATNATNPSTDSVDDHFAKALGETWTKLMNEKKDESTTTTTTRTTTSTTTSTSCSRRQRGEDEAEGEEEEPRGEVERMSPVEEVTISTTSSTLSIPSTRNTPPRLIST